MAPFDVRLPRSDEADEKVDTVVQPDRSVVCDASKLDERSGVTELRLVHPTDRVVTVYRHTGEGYGRSEAYELEGTLSPGIPPAVMIEWTRVLRDD